MLPYGRGDRGRGDARVRRMRISRGRSAEDKFSGNFKSSPRSATRSNSRATWSRAKRDARARAPHAVAVATPTPTPGMMTPPPALPPPPPLPFFVGRDVAFVRDLSSVRATSRSRGDPSSHASACRSVTGHDASRRP